MCVCARARACVYVYICVCVCVCVCVRDTVRLHLKHILVNIIWLDAHSFRTRTIFIICKEQSAEFELRNCASTVQCSRVRAYGQHTQFFYSAPNTSSSSLCGTIRTKKGIECLSRAIIAAAVPPPSPPPPSTPPPPPPPLPPPLPPPGAVPSSPKVPSCGQTRCSTAHGTARPEVAAWVKNSWPAVTRSMPGARQ